MKTDARMSCIFSWHWNKPEFADQWKYLSDMMNVSAAEQGETIWQTRFKEVQLLSVPSPAGFYRIAFKNYHEQRFFRYLCRPSLAAREAVGFAVVKSLGIPVADVLAFGENRRCLNLVNAYFITAFEEGTETLLYFKEHPEQHEMLLELLRENIRYLAQLHKGGGHAQDSRYGGAGAGGGVLPHHPGEYRKMGAYAQFRLYPLGRGR